jgi:hypothetical protein
VEVITHGHPDAADVAAFTSLYVQARDADHASLNLSDQDMVICSELFEETSIELDAFRGKAQGEFHYLRATPDRVERLRILGPDGTQSTRRW